MTRDPMFARLTGRGRKGGATLTAPWMGSDASRERAEREDEANITEWRIREVLGVVRTAGPMGATYKEIGNVLNWGHGQVTGATSPMHKAGLLEALAETRDGCTIYVLPEHVAGRQTRDYGGWSDQAKERIAALEQRIKELNAELAERLGEAEQANLRAHDAERRLLGAQDEITELRGTVRLRGELIELREQTIAAHQESINTLNAHLAALRVHRWAVRLEEGDGEVDLVRRLHDAVTRTQDRAGEGTVPFTLDSMRRIDRILQRLYVAWTRRPGQPEETGDHAPE